MRKKYAPQNRAIIGEGAAIYDQKITVIDVENNQTGYGLWSSASFSISNLLGRGFDSGLFTMSARYNENLIRERDDQPESVDGENVGGRYTHQFEDKLTGPIRGFVEGAYYNEEFGTITDRFTQAGIGLELRLQDNLFLQATVGDSFGSEIDRGEYLSGQLKWSFSRVKAK